MYRYIWKIKLNNNVSDDEFINFWRETSQILQEYDGAAGTLIHKARNEERSYFLVAQWESLAARDAMHADIDANESERAQRWNKYPKNDEFGEIQSVFAGEQIGEVTPKQSAS